MLKRIFAVALTLVMLLGMVPVAAFATEGTPEAHIAKDAKVTVNFGFLNEDGMYDYLYYNNGTKDIQLTTAFNAPEAGNTITAEELVDVLTDDNGVITVTGATADYLKNLEITGVEGSWNYAIDADATTGAISVDVAIKDNTPVIVEYREYTSLGHDYWETESELIHTKTYALPKLSLTENTNGKLVVATTNLDATIQNIAYICNDVDCEEKHEKTIVNEFLPDTHDVAATGEFPSTVTPYTFEKNGDRVAIVPVVEKSQDLTEKIVKITYKDSLNNELKNNVVEEVVAGMGTYTKTSNGTTTTYVPVSELEIPAGYEMTNKKDVALTEATKEDMLTYNVEFTAAVELARIVEVSFVNGDDVVATCEVEIPVLEEDVITAATADKYLDKATAEGDFKVTDYTVMWNLEDVAIDGNVATVPVVATEDLIPVVVTYKYEDTYNGNATFYEIVWVEGEDTRTLTNDDLNFKNLYITTDGKAPDADNYKYDTTVITDKDVMSAKNTKYALAADQTITVTPKFVNDKGTYNYYTATAELVLAEDSTIEVNVFFVDADGEVVEGTTSITMDVTADAEVVTAKELAAAIKKATAAPFDDDKYELADDEADYTIVKGIDGSYAILVEIVSKEVELTINMVDQNGLLASRTFKWLATSKFFDLNDLDDNLYNEDYEDRDVGAENIWNAKNGTLNFEAMTNYYLVDESFELATISSKMPSSTTVAAADAKNVAGGAKLEAIAPQAIADEGKNQIIYINDADIENGELTIYVAAVVAQNFKFGTETKTLYIDAYETDILAADLQAFVPANKGYEVLTENGKGQTITIELIDEKGVRQTGTKNVITVDLDDAHACSIDTSDEIELIPATCTSAGYKGGYECRDCGKRWDGEVITKLNHKLVTVKEVTPTHKDPIGCSKHKVCTVCGYTEGKTVLKLACNSDYEYIEATEPTCTEAGMTEGYICKSGMDCGGNIKPQPIAALGHTLGIVPRKAPTATEAGHEAYIGCVVCGEPAEGVTVEDIAAMGENPYVDVTSANNIEAIMFVTNMGLMEGDTNAAGERTFRPNDGITRAEAMVVLYNLYGATPVDTDAGFVDAGWAAQFINWAAANKITSGMSATEFGTNVNVKVQDMIVWMWHVVGDPTSTVDLSGYADADQIAAYAKDAMAWAVENGILNIGTDKMTGATNPANREKVAELIFNLSALLVK